MRRLANRLHRFSNGGRTPSPDDNYGRETPPVDRTSNPGPGSYHGGNTPEIEIRKTLRPVPREEATLEAEVGETVVTNLNHEGIPEFYRIGGKRHSRGGTPLNLPPNSFIYSRDNKMKIKDPNMLKFFGKNPDTKRSKKGYTPADLSKQYDLNVYRKILADPTSDKMQRETAQLMIQNYNLKLGALALAQESLKGFDRGLPAIGVPMLQRFGVEPSKLVEGQKPEDSQQQDKRVAQADMMSKKQKQEQQFRFGGHYMHGGDPTEHAYDDLGNTYTIPGMSDAAIAYQNSLSGVEPVPGPVDYTFMDVNAPSGREGFTMIHGVEDGNTENQYWVPDAEATGVIDHTKLKGKYPLVTSSDGTPYTLSMGAGYGDLTKEDNSLTGESIDDYRQTPPPNRYWSGGANGAQPTLEEGEYIDGNIIYNADGSAAGIKQKGQWVQLPGESTDTKEDVKVETSNKSTKKQNIPTDTDAEFFDPNAEGFDESKIEVGDYIKRDGKWYKVNQVKADPYKGDDIDTLPEVLKGESADLREDYGRLKYMIENNEDVRKEVIKRYRAKMKNAKPTNFLSASDIAVAQRYTDEEIINNMLESELQVMAINANKGMIRGSEGEADWDKKLVTDRNSPYYGLPKSYVETALELGFTPKSKGETYGFQTAYIELEKMANDPKYKDVLTDFTLSGDTQWGTGDETVEGVKNRTVSPADGWWGNTTTGQAALYNPEGKDWDYEEVGLPEEEEEQDIKGLEGVERNAPYGWTAPDVMQLGLDVRNRLGLKKYRPYAAKVAPNYFTPRFTSMEQPISKVNAQVLGAMETAGRLGQPGQAFAANYSKLGKRSADAIIDAGFKEQMFNTQTDNQARMFNTQTGNQANQTNVGLANQFYKGNVIANQNFDDAKRKTWQRFVTDYGTGWRNASNLQVMNYDNPNFNIAPWTGTKVFIPGTDVINANYNPQQDFTRTTQNFMKNIPGITPDKAADLAFKVLNPKAGVMGTGTQQQPYTMQQLQALQQQLNNQ